MWYGSQVHTYGRDKKNTENLSTKQQSCTKALTIIKINSIRNNCSSIKLLTITFHTEDVWNKYGLRV